MQVPDSDFTALLADYGRLSRRLAANRDEIDGNWPTRVAVMAEVVMDARNRVEMKALAG